MPQIGGVGIIRIPSETVTVVEKPTAGVTSISNTDGSLNIAPSVGVVVASLNVANPNTWTAAQTFGAGITGTGNTGSLTAGIGILGTANTWTGVQTYTEVIQTSQNGSTSNTGIGTGALAANTGLNNTAIGFQALNSSTTGLDNTAIGYNALFSNTTGSSNTAIGYQALNTNTAAFSNTAIGYQTLFSNTGTDNTAVGYKCGASLTTGSANVILGYFSDYLPAGTSNALNIANYIFGTGLTGTSTTISPSTANIGIGTSSPTATLHVVGTGLYTGLITANGGVTTTTITASGLITANGGITMAFNSTINSGVTLDNNGTILNPSGGTFTSAGTMNISGGTNYTGPTSTIILQPTGTATATATFSSNIIEFQASYWNGTAAVTISDTLQFNSNDTPITYIFPWPNSEVVHNNLFISPTTGFVPNANYGANITGTIATATVPSSVTFTTVSTAIAAVTALKINGINLQIFGHYTTGDGGTAPTAVSVPASGTAYTASTLYNTILTSSGGTVTAIAINGVTTGLLAGTFYLKASDTITFTYTVVPTVYQMFA